MLNLFNYNLAFVLETEIYSTISSKQRLCSDDYDDDGTHTY